MRISVYNIYVLALLVAAVAATLSGIMLNNSFNSHQSASELAQRNLGQGQVRAFAMTIDIQMERIRSSTEANTRQLTMWISRMPANATSPNMLVQSLNKSVYESWSPQIRANNSVNGFGVNFMYPIHSVNATYALAFGMWKDIPKTGDLEYAYAQPSASLNATDVYKNVWTDFSTPSLINFLYSYDPFALNFDSYFQNNEFTNTTPWAAKDGNSYWTFTHQNSLVIHGTRIVVQSWDVGVDWRDRMVNVCTSGAEMVVIDNRNMVLAATTQKEASRIADCRAEYVGGRLQAPCLTIPAPQHPVEEIRDLYNALFSNEWTNLTAPLMPISYHSVVLNSQQHMVVMASLFSSGRFRATVLWYQPWTEPPTDVTALIAIICILTVLSTTVLTVMGIFGILRPLIRLGRSMRSVADTLKYGVGGGRVKALVQWHSFFREVYAIQTDFETIAMDFLGFSSTRKAAEQADTVLNHILKNTMADAAACIQLYADGAAHVAPDLSQAVTCLARGMQWCRKRHVMLHISEGDYLPALHPVVLQEFGEQLVRGRAVISSFPSEVVLLDDVLCDILLDNALNNAFRHGYPSDPEVQFLMELVPLEEEAPCSNNNCGHGGHPLRQLTFYISNRADPGKPEVTPELLDSLLNRRVNCSGDPVYRSALSEHLGLHHMFRVAETHQMSLTLTQQADRVVLRARLKVQLTREPSLPDKAPPSLDDVVIPAGLRIWVLDDSVIARRLLQRSLPRYFPGAVVNVLGETAEEVPLFIVGAVEADIVILDQHLDYTSESFLGTSILADLLQCGCRAFICMRSASAVQGNDTAFRAAGANCALGKDLRPDEFFQTLKQLYKDFITLPTSNSALSLPLETM